MAVTWKKLAYAANLPLTPYAVGDLIYADSTTTLAKLADVAVNNALISGGVGAAPSWGKIGLTTHVSGLLPIANGGTGDATGWTTALDPGHKHSALWAVDGAPAAVEADSDGFIKVRNIGFLDTVPNALYGIYANKSYTDPASSTYGMNLLLVPTYTGAETVSELFFGINDSVCPIINTGHTNSGAIYGMNLMAVRNIVGASSDDSGTLTYLFGLSFTYGHFNSNAGATPQTTNAYGVRIVPYIKTGTITNMYDLFLATALTGGTATNRWGIYQQDTAPNYFGGNVGIGTPSPGAKLAVIDTAGWGGMVVKGGTTADGGQLQFFNSDGGGNYNLGIYGSAYPTIPNTFFIYDIVASVARLLIKPTGVITMLHYGAGTATFDASGNISSVSDERMKTILRKYTGGIAQLNGIEPIVHKWNKKSGMEMDHEYVGFSAQNVRENMPEAVYENKDGYLSYSDKAVIAALVNCVKIQQAQINTIQARLN